MNWEYGKAMLEEGAIKSLDIWSDDREYVYSTMDKRFDYLWAEDEEGIHFIDRLYHDGIADNLVDIRKKANELELHFKTIEDAKNWINIKNK